MVQMKPVSGDLGFLGATADNCPAVKKKVKIGMMIRQSECLRMVVGKLACL